MDSQILDGINNAIKTYGNWLLTGGLRILFIIILAFTSIKIINVFIDRFLKQRAKSDINNSRLTTLTDILKMASKLIIGILATMLVLGEFGIELGPIIATAGVVGLAVGFGAQELVKDTISGFFILLEDQVRVGDIVDLDGHAGLVENINLRTITLRDLSAKVHFVRNGNINTVTNMTRDYSSYVFDIGVSYNTDIDFAISIIKEVADKLYKESEFKNKILEPIEIFGLDNLAESSLIIKARFKTKPLEQWAVGREFNRRIKLAFDEKNIEIPFPHRTLYVRAEEPSQEWFKQIPSEIETIFKKLQK
ncbi:MAG: mechanosensitive ion channel family protein [Bdellovibrionales bacterium]|nr:mechanosensitive ion channel family protein [Bdellovibrionales bacterium]